MCVARRVWICAVQRSIAVLVDKPAKVASDVSKETAFVGQGKSTVVRLVLISAVTGRIAVVVGGLVRAESFAPTGVVRRLVRAKPPNLAAEAVLTPRTIRCIAVNATLRVRQGSCAKQANASARKDGPLVAISVLTYRAILRIVGLVGELVRAGSAARVDNALRTAPKVRQRCVWGDVSIPRPTANIADNAVSAVLHNSSVQMAVVCVRTEPSFVTGVASIQGSIHRIAAPVGTSATTGFFVARVNASLSVPSRRRRSAWVAARIHRRILPIVESAQTLVGSALCARVGNASAQTARPIATGNAWTPRSTRYIAELAQKAVRMGRFAQRVRVPLRVRPKRRRSVIRLASIRRPIRCIAAIATAVAKQGRSATREAANAQTGRDCVMAYAPTSRQTDSIVEAVIAVVPTVSPAKQGCVNSNAQADRSSATADVWIRKQMTATAESAV